MKPENLIDVFGLGAIAVDFIGVTDAWPGQGVKIKLKDLIVSGGGLVATALTAVTRLGGKAAIAARLGNSIFAIQSLTALGQEGVDTFNVIRDQGDPVVSFVLTDETSGERNIFFSRKGVSYPFPEEFPDQEWYEKCRVLIIDHGTGIAGVKTAGIARKKGIPVIIDAERVEPEIDRLLDLSDHIIVGQKFAAQYSGKTGVHEMIQSLRSRESQVIIITMGDRGLTGFENGNYFTQEAFPVKSIDTTGCGDAFHGAYALGIAKGWSVRKCSVFASGTAAMNAMKHGAREGIPNFNELMKFFKQAGIDFKNS